MISAASGQGFALDLKQVGFHGAGLTRPECILAFATGDLWVSNWDGGVSRIAPDGEVEHLLAQNIGEGATPPIGTNGFAMTRDGDFLLANLHPNGYGVWRLGRDGIAEPFLVEIEGRRMPPANYVGLDRKDRIWISVSTWEQPRSKAYRPNHADGFVVLVDKRGARIAADGIGYTNEAIVHPSGDWLYVNETMGRRTLRFPIKPDGSLGPRETVTEYPAGTFPDGLAFDEAGGFWMTSVVSNRLFHVAPDGAQTVVLEDSDPEWTETVESAYREERMASEHLSKITAKLLKSISSITFGGPDRRTAYLGSLLDERLYSFTSPVAGAEPAHWRWKP